MFMAHPAMREWADGVIQALNKPSLNLMTLTKNGHAALADFQVHLETCLQAASIIQRAQDGRCAPSLLQSVLRVM
jgi:hypothetical protein